MLHYRTISKETKTERKMTFSIAAQATVTSNTKVQQLQHMHPIESEQK